MSDEVSSVLRIPVFDGEVENYHGWMMRFQAYARVKGFSSALKKNVDLPDTEEEIGSLDQTQPTQKKKITAGKKNVLAMAHITMALGTDTLLDMVNTVCDDNWPGGLAYKLIEDLEKEYQPTDRVAGVEMKRKMSNVKMNKYDKPTKLIAQIKAIENQYSGLTKKMDEEDKIALVLEKAPKEYASILAITEEDKGSNLTMKDLEKAMMTQYRIRYGDDEVDADGEELALSAFSGKCYNCGKIGHRANKCPHSTKKKSEGGKFTGKCHGCGKTGHKLEDCWENEKNVSKRPAWYRPKEEKGMVAANSSQQNDSEFLLAGTESNMEFTGSSSILKDPNVFIGDTGATCDTTFSDLGLLNVYQAGKKDNIVDASGNGIEGKVVGDLPCTVCNKKGQEQCAVMIKGMVHMPQAGYNLFSLTKRLDEGWTLGGSAEAIWIEKGGKRITFDIKIKTPKGAIFAIYLKRKMHNENEVAAVVPDKTKAITAKLAHALVGHMGEAQSRKVVKHLGFTVSRGAMPKCEPCAQAKAKQKSLPSRVEVLDKQVHDKATATAANERLFLDISTIKAPKHIKVIVMKPQWRMIVDEFTGMKWSHFFEAKNEMIEPTCMMLSKWQQGGKAVKYIRLDNAGENTALAARSGSAVWKLNIQFEFTARDTPQQNSLVEVGFNTIGNRARAMMTAANVPEKEMYKLFREAFTCATMLDWLTIVTINGVSKSRVEHWNGTMPRWVRALRTWGEAGVVKTKTATTPKMKPRGVTCFMSGYAVNHSEGVYRMWNPKTNRVLISRDVTWLKRMYYQPRQPPAELTVSVEHLDIEDRESDEDVVSSTVEPGAEDAIGTDDGVNVVDGASEVVEAGSNEENRNDEQWEQFTQTRAGRVVRPVQRMGGRYDHLAAMALTEAEFGYQVNLREAAMLEFALEDYCTDYNIAAVGAGLGGGFENTRQLKPMKYDEAMATDREGWTKAVEEEHDRMVTNNVWRPIKLSELPKDTKILTSTWACKLKSNGRKRARLNARGYEQIDGIHYDGSSIHAPVTNDTSVRTVMVLALMAGWTGLINDVQGAFLKGKLDQETEKMAMKVPQGFEHHYDENVVLWLLMAIYGTKQAAMAFWRELLRCMRHMGYKRSGADPCLYFKWTAAGLVAWLSWIDDCMVWGHDEVVHQESKEFTSRFDCDEVGEVKEYVGCKIEHNKKENYIKFTQPVLLQSYLDEFEIGTRTPNTPAEAGSVLVKSAPEDVVQGKQHTYFRSGVGKMLHMMRWSRPEVQNAVRELTRQGSAPTKAHIKAMHRAMEYCVGTPNRGWLLRPTRKWDGKDKSYKFRIRGQSDSDYAKCPVTRRSVSGYATFLEDAPVTVKSAMQKIVTLSVTEAETVSAVQCVQDMLYVKRLLESMELQVELPMILEVDNRGAVDLANNWSAGGRTRHMQTRMFFLRDLQEEELVKVMWLKGDDNPVDLFTKNLAGPAFNKCAKVFVGDDEYVKKGISE